MVNTDAARRPTVKDVARVAGVSASTVSNVLHDHPHVSEDKKASVSAAIDELGYVPSFVGRQLRSRRTDVLALAIPDLGSPYFAALAHAFVAEAHRRAVALFIDETGGDPERERAIARGYPGRGVTGVVFCPTAITPAELERENRDVPFVLLGEYVRHSPLDHIAIDSRRSADEATVHLIEGGRRRIAFAGMHLGSSRGPAYLRLLGVQAACDRNGVPLAPDLVIDLRDHTRAEGRRAASRLLPRIGDVDALVCAADLVAIGALAALREARIAVPGDVAVLGWDDSEEGEYTSPALTSVAHDIPSIARDALDALERRVDDPRRATQVIVVDHRLVVRESTAAV